MTPDETLYSMLAATGIRGTKVGWPDGKKVPPLPWFVYRHRKKGEFFADNSNYAKLPRYEVDLYQAEPNEEEVDAIEEALAKIGPYACIESWVPMESAWVTSYTLTFHPEEQ